MSEHKVMKKKSLFVKPLLKEDISLHKISKTGLWFHSLPCSWWTINVFLFRPGWVRWRKQKREKDKKRKKSFRLPPVFSEVIHWFSVCLCDCWLLGWHIVSYFPLGHSVNFQQLVSVGVLLKIALAIKISGQTVLSNSPLGTEKKSLLALSDLTASGSTELGKSCVPTGSYST